jgi:hypothetical protein
MPTECEGKLLENSPAGKQSAKRLFKLQHAPAKIGQVKVFSS